MFCSNFGFDIVDSVDKKEGLRMIDLDTRYKFLFSSTSLLYSRLLIFFVCLEFKVLQYRKIRFKKSYSNITFSRKNLNR